MLRFNPKKMTFSAFERYVRIVEGVRDSKQHLTGGNRMQLICDLLEEPCNFSEQEIEARCKELSDEVSGDNMINAMILRDAHRGY